MGFLDDLDSAFDDLLSQPKGKPQSEPNAQEDLQDEALALKTEIAELHAAGVTAIFGLLEHLPRVPVLTALHGSLVYLSLIEPQGPRLEEIRNMVHALETQKGSIRRRLTQSQLQELAQRQAHLPSAGPADQDQAKALLTALSHQRAIPAKEYHALYKAGIWQAVQFTKGSADQLAHLSGLPLPRVTRLKAAVTIG